MNITRQLLALAGVGAMASVGAFASVSPAQTSAPHNRFINEVETVLSMTPKQKDQLQSCLQQARQQAMPIRQELNGTNKALQSAVKSNDKSQIQTLSKTEGQEIGQLLAIRSSTVAKVYNTLTPQQRTQADALHQLLERGMRQDMGQAQGRS